MIQKIFYRLTGGAAILTITTFFSYLTGLARDRIFAHTFGASRELDLYNTSFIIPDLLLNILVSSALSAAFIPLFTSLYTQNQKEKAHELGNTIMHTAVFAIVIFAIITAIFMPLLAPLIAPGFTGADRETLISLSRLMLISPVIMAISSSLGAMLVSFKSFLAYGISPIVYNLGIIAGAFASHWLGVYGLVAGTVLGALLHLSPRIIAIRRSSFRYEPRVRLRDSNFIRVVKLMIPKMIGHPVEQLTFLGFTRIASLLAAGSVTAISFARNFQSVPVALFGIAFSVAIFPVLSSHAAASNRTQFLQDFHKALRNILIFTIPAALGMYLLSELPIRIFLGGGKFSDENIVRTAHVLSIFALSIPTESLVHLLARSFYALKNTVTPVVLSLVGFACSMSFAYLNIETLGIIAIPYGFFIGSLIEVILLSTLLWRKMRVFEKAPAQELIAS